MSMFIRSIALAACAVSYLAIAGCGGQSGELTTSSVTTSVDTLVMDSDVVSWVDSAGAKTTACSLTSFPAVPAADSVNVTISSKAYSNTGSAGLRVRVNSATITYTPANSATPPMASEYQVIGGIIANGGSLSVPVRVSTQEQKLALQSALACNNNIYNYYTKITFNISEEGTDKSTTVDASMQLRFADFVDK